jgi:hypothetical protein
MADTTPLPRGGTRTREDSEAKEIPGQVWERAVLDGDAAPAVAVRFPIHDLQHWLDLSA